MFLSKYELDIVRCIIGAAIIVVAFGSLERSPKIIARDGNVIFETGINKNVSIRLNGRSRLLVNEFDLLDLLVGPIGFTGNSSEPTSINGISLRVLQADVNTLRGRLFGRGGLNSRLRRLQNRTIASNPIGVLRRTQRRVSVLEVKVRNLIKSLRSDKCKSNPCENGGTCIKLFDDFLCKCIKGFEGKTCSSDVNECALYSGTDLGCQNGAQCINQFGSYSCICNSGWQGIHCNQRKTDCLHSSNAELCGHGTCVNTNDNFGYRCICDEGWKTNGLTPSCNVDVDECSEFVSACRTKCINLPGGFMCAPCEAGYTGNGLSCRDIDECATNNGGCSVAPFVRCINTYGSYHCGECPVGWTGDGRVCTRSSTQSCLSNNICHPVALCQEVSNRIICSCPMGMIGNGVGPNGCLVSGNNACSSNPCLNGGTCMDSGNGSYTCLCPLGYKLPLCEQGFNPCSRNPCRNGGTCQPQGVNFICICVTGYVGRHCNSQRSRCGQYITSEQGNLKYPLGDLYNHNAQCSWVIRTNETKVLNITFTKFEIEDSSKCHFDWLQLHDGPTTASQLIGRFCGSQAPRGGNIITTTNKIYIWFKSDNSTAKAGFDLFWTSIDPICGGIIEFDSHTTISSPGSPGNYPPNRDCKWHLKVSEAKRIKLVFFNLQIETHTGCNQDFIEITDAISGRQLEKFCSSSNPAPFTASSNEIIIHFHSDNHSSDLGFQIHASTVERIPGCGGTYTERYGQIVSPFGFEGPMSCEYIVRYPKGLKIQLQVNDFKMGDEDCIEIFDVDGRTKVSVGRWCGKMTVPIIKSTGNEIQINYYSRGGTFKLTFDTLCEYRFEEPTGVIISPNYPSPYPSDETCTYEIMGDINQLVELEFVDMDLESHAGISACWFDYVSVTDGNNETAAGPFCGTTLPPKIISSSNYLKLTLMTDRSNAGRGFKANYTLIDAGKNCGGFLRKSSGEIRLPTDSSTGTYEHDLTCIWTIIAPVGFGVQLSFISFRLEESNDCLYDYVEIYDTDNISSQTAVNGRFCGYTVPPAIVSATNILTLKFSSDLTDAEDGFLAKYNFVDVSKLCGGSIFSTTGKINSPNWPNEYPNDLNCSWSITVRTGYQIELRVKSMDLEESNACSNDWLELRNGGSSSSPFIGKYCGRTIPTRIPSFTHQIHVNFRTNSEVTKTGFHMEWSMIASGCGGVLTGEQGSIASPFYPQPYSNEVQCEWIIRIPKGSTILINFEDLNLESLLFCAYDYVEIYDGATPDRRKIGKYCEKRPDILETTGSEALVRFQTDSSNTNRGFFLTYKSNCNHVLTEKHGAIETPNYGDNNPSEMNCTWTVKAPKGNTIILDFEVVGRKDSATRNEFIYIKEEGNSSVIPIAKTIRFETRNSSINIWVNSSSIYFRMEYTIQGCYEILHREEGSFTSPGYPKPNPTGMECLWEIETEVGQAIELVFDTIDVVHSTNCTENGIQVWDAPINGHMMGSLCGSRSNVTITSTGHTMLVKFYSESSHKGFSAHYKTFSSICGGKLIMSKGTILSPNYPNNYGSDLSCEWIVEVPNDTTIEFTLDELDIEDSLNCSMDVVKIYDGAKTNDPMRALCGNEMPSETIFRTTLHTATIVFETDSDTESKGFKISFKEMCGKQIVVNETGRIRFSGSDESVCLWTLSTEDPTKHITFTTTHFKTNHIFSTVPCSNNSVMIFDGYFTNTTFARPAQQFCDKHLAAYTSLGHALTIVLVPAEVAEFEGFYSLMDNNCGGQLDSLHGAIASPSYPIAYPVNVECVWQIVATEGNALTLTIQAMDIDKTDDCNGDYLEVREGNSNGNLLGVFCGDNVANPLTALKSFWIKFNSDDDVVGKGFIAEYSYAYLTELNGTEGILESPRYPSPFVSQLPHMWRITVTRGYLIMLAIDYLSKSSNVLIYNGFDKEAESIDYSNTNIIKSDTNVLYLESNKGVFQLHWYEVSKEFVANNDTSIKAFSKCANQIVNVGGQSTVFQSPGYPHGYDAELNCSWIIMPANMYSHAVIEFQKIDLEEHQLCLLDRVIIYSSADMTQWKQLDKKCRLDPNTVTQYSGDRYLKIEFLTDSGINKTGFSAMVRSACGAILTDSAGFINVSSYMSPSGHMCVWQIQVKPGRRIKITFSDTQLANDNISGCLTYVLLKNGFQADSPNLGIGKYCDNNFPEIPVTSSNKVYIKVAFWKTGYGAPKISFKYEEVMNDCSHDITLSDDQTSVVINTENYPNIPQPHTRCSWSIRAPTGRLLTINFADPFDLSVSALCALEYVEVHDGATDLAPLIGRFCGKSVPNTQYSTGNSLRITHFTDIPEPHFGFKANVSLGICGGTYRMPTGTITSPKTLGTRTNFSCNYHIYLPEGNAVNLTVNDIDLNYDRNCSLVNHLQLVPIYEDESEDVKPIIICGSPSESNYLIEANKVLISYNIINTDFHHNRFKFTYETVGHQCDQTLEAESGILKSPGYLHPINKPIRCVWKIKVPKGRRVKLEFLDHNLDARNWNRNSTFNILIPSRLIVANDFSLRSIIARISSNPPTVLYSTDNLMSLMSFEAPRTQKQGFKLRFSSDEESVLCNENLDRNQGVFHFNVSLNQSVYCHYDINVQPNETVALTVDRIEMKDYILQDYYHCIRHGPLSIRDVSGRIRATWFCGKNDTTLRFPYPISLDVFSNTFNMLRVLDMKFQRHPCGGVFTIGSQLDLTQPRIDGENYGPLDCAWRVLPNPGDLDQFEISVKVDFKLKCDEQYLVVYSDASGSSPQLGRFCNQVTADKLVSMKDLLIQYHTSRYENASSFNLTAKISTGCGGDLYYPFRLIDFRQQYENNVECIWTISTEKGYHIGLTFSGRFFIESSVNCTKDYILIQEQGEQPDEWRDITRICGRVPPSALNTTMNKMRFIFRSDDSGTGDGFTANFERNCGGIFKATKDMQQLFSPNYPEVYGYNLTCNYTILPSTSNTNLLVQFLDFVLEDYPTASCLFDNVTIYLDSEAPVVLCGVNHDKEFRSTTPITIIFHSDSSYSRKGFLFQYGDELCGGVITSTTQIASPFQKSDLKYPANAECIWNITAPEGSKIVIKFEKFDFEGSYACSYDYVQLFSGKFLVENQRVARLCGNLTGRLPTFSIKSNLGIIQSISDRSEPSVGFSAVVSIVKDCDREILLKDVFDQKMLSFTDGYENNLDCEIVFKAPPMYQISMEFTSFHIEDSPGCSNDYVEIRDGGGPFADAIGTFCGHIVPNTIVGSRSTLYLRFVTDSEGTSSGFSVMAKNIPKVCGAQELHINSSQSVSVSLGVDKNYLPNLNCLWRLRSDYNIRLDFEKLDIQGPDANGTCSTDYLKVSLPGALSVVETPFSTDILFNNEGGNDVTGGYNMGSNEHVYCGQKAPSGYYTNSQEVFLKFSSDSTIERTGFKVLASAANKCFKNFTSTQGRILMETDGYCDFYINVPQNFSITIYFSYFFLFAENNDCSASVEVFDETANSKSLRKLCGSIDPSNSVFTNSNSLKVRLNNNGPLNSFDITFVATTEGPGCGGDIYNTAGLFTSPFFSQNARNNSDCRWNIMVPHNMIVALEFKVFDLGSKVTCRSDYVQVIEKETTGDEVTRQFCGEDTPVEYKGRRNVLSVRYRKTVNFDGTGWVIQFYATHP